MMIETVVRCSDNLRWFDKAIVSAGWSNSYTVYCTADEGLQDARRYQSFPQN